MRLAEIIPIIRTSWVEEAIRSAEHETIYDQGAQKGIAAVKWHLKRRIESGLS